MKNLTAIDQLQPQEHWGYVGCPTCGMVTTVPLDRAEPTPRCVHNGTTIVWREQYPMTTSSNKAWTLTIRVKVLPL